MTWDDLRNEILHAVVWCPVGNVLTARQAHEIADAVEKAVLLKFAVTAVGDGPAGSSFPLAGETGRTTRPDPYTPREDDAVDVPARGPVSVSLPADPADGEMRWVVTLSGKDDAATINAFVRDHPGVAATFVPAPAVVTAPSSSVLSFTPGTVRIETEPLEMSGAELVAEHQGRPTVVRSGEPHPFVDGPNGVCGQRVSLNEQVVILCGYPQTDDRHRETIVCRGAGRPVDSEKVTDTNRGRGEGETVCPVCEDFVGAAWFGSGWFMVEHRVRLIRCGKAAVHAPHGACDGLSAYVVQVGTDDEGDTQDLQHELGEYDEPSR